MRACAACLLAVVAAGCGGGPSDAQRVRAKAREFARATRTHDARALCERILAPDLVRAAEQASAQPCERAVRSLFAGSPPQEHTSRVLVDGDLATARLGRETITLVRTGAGWRLTSVGNDGGPSRP